MSKPVGLRTEILTTLSLLMGAALLLGGVLMLRLTEQSLLEQKLSQLRIMNGFVSRSVVERLSVATQQGSRPTSSLILDYMKELTDELNHQGWWLYGADLQLIASYRLDAGEPFSAPRHQRLRISGDTLETVEFPSLLQIFSATVANVHFAQPLYDKSRFLGILDIRYSLEDIRYRLLLSQRMILLYVLLYGSVLVGIGYYLLQRNIIKPARNLLQATEDVSRGHLGTRLPVAGPVEIAHLATAYNQMVDALEHSRSETQSHIAALQQTNKDLQQAREELIRSEKLASVGQLAAGLAHELGNPLAALTGYLEVLKLRITSATELDVVTRSITEAGRIDFLVCELLDFSRPGENQTELLSPAQELRSVVQLLQHQGSLAGIETVDHLGEGLPRVQINRHKLQQLFVNLLLNATQACAGQGQIRLSAGQTGNVVWLTIADNGCGIATDQLGRIFDPFYTTKEPGEGTGLGLSICHRIVDEAGGKILAESDFGKGSSFRVEFPALV